MLSYKESIIPILKAVDESCATRILDVGCAFGKYGLLIREQYLSKKSVTEIIPTDDIIIDACEYTKYFYDRPALEHIYNKVIKESMFDIKEFPYDLVLLIDVVEHYPKEDMKEFIKKIGTKVLISTPKNVHMYTEKYYGDEHVHISQWQAEDFVGKDYSTDLSHIFIVN